MTNSVQTKTIDCPNDRCSVFVRVPTDPKRAPGIATCTACGWKFGWNPATQTRTRLPQAENPMDVALGKRQVAGIVRPVTGGSVMPVTTTSVGFVGADYAVANNSLIADVRARLPEVIKKFGVAPQRAPDPSVVALLRLEFQCAHISHRGKRFYVTWFREGLNDLYWNVGAIEDEGPSEYLGAIAASGRTVQHVREAAVVTCELSRAGWACHHCQISPEINHGYSWIHCSCGIRYCSASTRPIFNGNWTTTCACGKTAPLGPPRDFVMHGDLLTSNR